MTSTTPDAGEIPRWLPEEFHAAWAEGLAGDGRPQFTRNATGWYVRVWGRQTEKTAESSKAAGSDKAGNQDGEYTEENLQEDIRLLRGRGAWAAGDDLPPPVECCFEGILPARGLGNLDGQWGTHKTHLLVDVAVALSCPGESKFAGRKRLRRGGVVIFESEESEIPIRLACAAKYLRYTHRRAANIYVPGNSPGTPGPQGKPLRNEMVPRDAGSCRPCL